MAWYLQYTLANPLEQEETGGKREGEKGDKDKKGGKRGAKK